MTASGFFGSIRTWVSSGFSGLGTYCMIRWTNASGVTASGVLEGDQTGVVFVLVLVAGELDVLFQQGLKKADR